MAETHRISGKDLGQLALPSFCPRCFWIGRKAPMGLPYQMFPGIFFFYGTKGIQANVQSSEKTFHSFC